LGFGVRERENVSEAGKVGGRVGGREGGWVGGREGGGEREKGLAQAEENRCRPGSPLARDASDEVDVEDGKEKGEAVEDLG
jgi:hypothetical protein